MVLCAEFFLGKEPSRERLKRILIIIGGFLGIVGGLLGAISQGRDTYKLLAAATGGDSYCYMDYAYPTDKYLQYGAQIHGPDPQYDVIMRIEDHNAFLKIRGDLKGGLLRQPTSQDMEPIIKLQEATLVNVPVGNVHPEIIATVWRGPIPPDDLQDYYVTIDARNGIIREELLIQRKDGGRYISAVRVWKSNGKIVGGWRMMDLVQDDASPEFHDLYPSGIPWTMNPNR